MPILEFTALTPDLPALGNPGMMVARNVFPRSRGYGPVPAPTNFPGITALGARCVGAISAKDKSGNSYSYSATVGSSDAGRLYRLNGVTQTNASGNGANGTPGYAFPEGEPVEFIKWADTVIAFGINEPVQSIALGGTAFANLIGSTRVPRFRHGTVLKDFVVGGNCDDVGNDGIVPNRVWWSGIGDPATFEDGTGTTQSDFQDLASGGTVQKVVGGEVGRIFCETSIHRMSYLGYSPWFQFDEIEVNRGVWIPGSVAVHGNSVIFLDRDGWYRHDGQVSVSIGINAIDEQFLSELDPQFGYMCFSVIDPVRKLYHFIYPNRDATAGLPNRLLSYDIVNQRWSFSDITAECIFLFLASGYNMDTLDSITASLDDLGDISLDSATFQAQGQEIAIIDSSHKLSVFQGAALTAVLETGERQILGPGSTRTMVGDVRPLIDGAGTVTVQTLKRNLQSEDPSEGSSVAMNAFGNCPMRENARFHRFRITIEGGFTDAIGLDISATAAAGRR